MATNRKQADSLRLGYSASSRAEPGEPALARLAPAVASLSVIAVAALVVGGWIADIPTLKSISPAWTTMKVNTATCFFLAGLALWLLRDEHAEPGCRFVGRVCAAVVAVLATLTLGEYVFHVDLGIDQLLLEQVPAPAGEPSPARMSAATACNFLLIGTALFGLDWKTRSGQRPAFAFAALTAFSGLLAFAGYLYEAKSLYDFSPFSSIALHSALSFVVLAIGTMCARSGPGPLQILTSRGIGGVLARRLLPFAVVVPFLLGWLRLMGERAGLFGFEFGLALFATSNVFVFTILISRAAVWLDRTDLELAQASQALAISERRFRALTEHSADSITVIDADNNILYLSPAVETVEGYTPEELIGRNGLDDTHPDDLALIAETVRLIMANPNQPIPVLWRRRHKNGNWIWLEGVGTNLLADPAVGGIVTNYRDVTARVEAEQKVRELNATLERRVTERTAELEAANKELEAFSYSVSHDLRAPLRAIDGFSQALEEDCAPQLSPEGRRYVHLVREGAQRMGVLVDDLLTFSRLSRQPLRRQTVDTQRLVRAVLDDLAAERQDRRIEIRIEELAPCQGDPALLKQVWANLLSNAFKYTRKRELAVIEIRSETTPEGVVYSVRDNGTGFDMKYAPKVFGVFQRLHRSEDYEGTGVGLAIVERIVHRHKGRVWAEAEVDRGATLYFTLGKETQPWTITT